MVIAVRPVLVALMVAFLGLLAHDAAAEPGHQVRTSEAISSHAAGCESEPHAEAAAPAQAPGRRGPFCPLRPVVGVPAAVPVPYAHEGVRLPGPASCAAALRAVCCVVLRC
ncbi:hypothetical protein [Streptomyces beijiangensis]|uniref:Secreted protein n=1 Tax=Streptomyces beijiangensis TaxID=163361 RepID=A0A939FDR7_9ACTN|nr:hypothetical protein [Streptomyces beijiangensis]MBO0517446.1 hypothetical protein [Streptomyces beijiangensis]